MRRKRRSSTCWTSANYRTRPVSWGERPAKKLRHSSTRSTFSLTSISLSMLKTIFTQLPLPKELMNQTEKSSTLYTTWLANSNPSPESRNWLSLNANWLREPVNSSPNAKESVRLTRHSNRKRNLLIRWTRWCPTRLCKSSTTELRRRKKLMN